MGRDRDKLREHPIECAECGAIMHLIHAKYGLFYSCSKFPECRGTHGAHPDGRPLGVPATAAVRKLRREVHELAENLWKWKIKRERKAMYVWLKNNTASGHIGEMEQEELITLKAKLQDLINERSRG